MYAAVTRKQDAIVDLGESTLMPLSFGGIVRALNHTSPNLSVGLDGNINVNARQLGKADIGCFEPRHAGRQGSKAFLMSPFLSRLWGSWGV